MLKRLPLWCVASLLGSITIVVSLINALRSGSILVGDRAVFALQVSDAATGSFPAVGQYSWLGWNHPGSLIFYIFAPFHWLSGGASWGIFVGTASYSLAALFLISWLGDRLRGAWGSALGVATLLAGWISVGRIASVDSWTPYLALPLFILFVIAAWGVTERDRASMWVMWITGALAIQIHIGYLPVVTIILVGACAMFWWTGGNQRSLTRPLATALLMFAPFVFHFREAAGNIADLAQYFTSADTPTVGWMRALRVLSFEMSPNASWLAGPSEIGLIGETPEASALWLVGVVVALTVTTIWAWRSPENSPRRKFFDSAPVMWAALLSGIVALAQVRGYLFPYIVLWRSVIVILVVIWIVGVVLANTTMIRQPMLTVVAMGLFILNVIGATLAGQSDDTVTSDASNIQLAIDQAVEVLQERPVDGEILLKLGDGGLVGLYPTLVYEFEQRGIPSGIEPGTQWVFGDRVVGNDIAKVWMVCDTGYALSVLSLLPQATVVSRVTPFSAEDEKLVVQLQDQLARELRTIGRPDLVGTLDSSLVEFALSGVEVDQQSAQQLGAFNAQTPEPGFRFGIVEFAPDEVPTTWWSLNVFS